MKTTFAIRSLKVEKRLRSCKGKDQWLRSLAVDHQGKTVHHSVLLLTHGNSMLAEPGQEILGITGFHTIPTELIANEVGHGSILLRQINSRVGSISNGLNINTLIRTYSIHTQDSFIAAQNRQAVKGKSVRVFIPGVFSGMKIVSYIYAAFQQFIPGVDVGIDLSREYAAVNGR